VSHDVPFAEEARGLLAVRLFEREECRRIVEHVAAVDGWDDATVRVREDGQIVDVVSRDARAASVLSLWQAPELVERFDEQINTVISPLIQNVWRVRLETHAGAQLVRYAPGGHYDTHQDAGATCTERYFSVVCYLNDDFDGGGTYFPDLNHMAVPASGKAIIFPSQYFHRAEPVVRGEKFVAVTWIVGPVPIRWV
jgi:hypothetical protein